MVDPRMDAFRVSSRAVGIDLMRSKIGSNLGTWVANAAATFYAGQLVSLNASQEVVLTDGVAPFGFAKYTRATGQYATVVGEYIQLNAAVATNLAHTNLYQGAGGIATVRVGAALTGAAYTEAADYTCNYANGTIVRILPGTTIPDGGYVYVNYIYPLTNAQLKYEGANFWNSQNDVTIQNERVTVINGKSIIFTTWYDPHVTYAVNDILTAGTTAEVLRGMVTVGGAGAYVGRVIQVPTAADPFLGIDYVGGMVS